MLPFLQGPMLITKASGNIYTLNDLVTQTEKDYHISYLREFLYDPDIQKPLDYAIRDRPDIFVVEEILELIGNPKNSRKNLKFKVKWIGSEEVTVRESSVTVKNAHRHRVQSSMSGNYFCNLRCALK